MDNYTGYLLAAHPLRKERTLQQSVMCVVNYGSSGVFGLQINHPVASGFKFINLMERLNFSTDYISKEMPLYYGGDLNTSRVYILHSSDWFSSSTIKFSSSLCLTSDLSILSAFSANQGPKYFRPIIGTHCWKDDALEVQMRTVDNDFNNWYYTVPNIKLLYGSGHEKKQWINVLNSAGNLQVKKWFT